jgi:hypothetical protein
MEKIQTLYEIVKHNEKNFNTPAWIFGSSRNLKLVNKNSIKGIRIGVGDTPRRAPMFGPYDFWVTANTIYPLPWVKKHRKHIMRSSSHLLMSTMAVNNNDVSWYSVNESLDNLSKLTVFDSKHFNNTACSPESNCCKLYKTFVNDLSIQEMLSLKIGKQGNAYSTGSTVALHGLALAILLNCNPIYIMGVDLPQFEKDYKYYNDFYQPHLTMVQMVKRYLQIFFHKKIGKSVFGGIDSIEIISDFSKIGQIADQLGISVFVGSPESQLLKIKGFKFLKV